MTSRGSIPPDKKPRVDAVVETLVYLYTESRRLTKTLAREFGLTGPQLTVIKILEQLGDLSLTSLSSRIRAKNSTVTGIIDRMEREDLVLRERSSEDRRIVLIRLTAKGRQLASQIHIEPMEIFRRALERLSRKDIVELFRILCVLQDNVREAIAHSAPPSQSSASAD